MSRLRRFKGRRRKKRKRRLAGLVMEKILWMSCRSSRRRLILI